MQFRLQPALGLACWFAREGPSSEAGAGARGSRMSDSILYLSIVAIWAGFLIPAWLRRPSTAKDELSTESAELAADALTDPQAEQATSDPDGDVATELVLDTHMEASGDNSEYRYDVHMHSYNPTGRRPSQRPSQSRQQMMRARRRMLTILTALVVITGGFVLTGLVQWWICVPPVAMVVLYVLLLREIAMSDAELARKRTAWEARTARDLWRRAHEAWQAETEAKAAAEQTATIIDIFGRVGDQLYDQYADAAVRAVGD